MPTTHICHCRSITRENHHVCFHPPSPPPRRVLECILSRSKFLSRFFFSSLRFTCPFLLVGLYLIMRIPRGATRNFQDDALATPVLYIILCTWQRPEFRNFSRAVSADDVHPSPWR
uniref:Uncharacterized protein n=1 Tax=Schizaphis graminum TaxID=13262 RepID=A0A2S2NZ11_SCHGA